MEGFHGFSVAIIIRFTGGCGGLQMGGDCNHCQLSPNGQTNPVRDILQSLKKNEIECSMKLYSFFSP